jgi:hypothetical protein
MVIWAPEVIARITVSRFVDFLMSMTATFNAGPTSRHPD